MNLKKTRKRHVKKEIKLKKKKKGGEGQLTKKNEFTLFGDNTIIMKYFPYVKQNSNNIYIPSKSVPRKTIFKTYFYTNPNDKKKYRHRTMKKSTSGNMNDKIVLDILDVENTFEDILNDRNQIIEPFTDDTYEQNEQLDASKLYS